MARGRIGGTRAKIRGAVGSEIYQIHKSSDGKGFTQLVMSRPEERENPNTEAQAIARMKMGQIQRMFHILPDLIKNAYAKVVRGSMSFQHFAKLNYALLQADIDEHWHSGNMFDWQPKHRMTAPAGIWRLTEGHFPELTPDSFVFSYATNNGFEMVYNIPYAKPTVGQVLDYIGLKMGDDLVFLMYRKDYPYTEPYIYTFRFHVSEAYAAETLWEDTFENDVIIPEDEDMGQSVLIEKSNRLYISWEDANPPKKYVVCCGAWLVIRKDGLKTIWSSSQFRWLEQDGKTYYPKWPPATAYAYWHND